MAISIPEKHSFLSLSAQMAELCKPIEVFGIHHFTLLKQFSDGRRISLSNKPSWIEDYYNLNLYQSSLFENPFKAEESSFNLWFNDYDLEVYRHGKLYYNTMHSISIVEQHEKFYETFLFATTPDNPQAIHFLSNNRDILYHFILYLKDRGKALFREAEKNSIIITEAAWDMPKQETFWFQNPEWLAQLKQHKASFLAKTPVHQVTFEKGIEKVHFTQREISCIVHLLNYKTATETAKLMNISPRTVESYLETIKTKLSCNNKSELIQKLKGSPYWSAIFQS